MVKSDFSPRKQEMWTRQNIKAQKDDPFWRHTGYVVTQLDGLYLGAQKRASEEKIKVRLSESV
jgi:hypothetical protein